MSAPVGIVGAGAFGTALAAVWAATGPVVLLGRDRAAMEAAAETRRVARLPDVALPAAVRPTADAAALADCPTLVLAVPVPALGAVLASLPRPLAPRHVVAASKGVERRTLRGPTAIAAERFPGAVHAILSGPSFAADIARGLPTALSLGCADDGAGRMLQDRLSTAALRLYRTTDVRGVELGGALKNVVAIACGAAMGAGLGESARAACMTRGMAEMRRLAVAMGARAETLAGLSGLGDLALTCSSLQSRNHALGFALGRGEARPDATAEGVPTAEAAAALARAHGVAMPLGGAVADVLAGRRDVRGALQDLLARDLTTET